MPTGGVFFFVFCNDETEEYAKDHEPRSRGDVARLNVAVRCVQTVQTMPPSVFGPTSHTPNGRHSHSTVWSNQFSLEPATVFQEIYLYMHSFEHIQ